MIIAAVWAGGFLSGLTVFGVALAVYNGPPRRKYQRYQKR